MQGISGKHACLNQETLRMVEEEIASGIPEIMVDLIDTYLQDGHRQFHAARNALAEGDTESVALSAHSLKSTSATFGAEVLASLCAEIEDRTHRQTLESVPWLLAQAEQEWQAVKQALDRERRRLLN